MVSLTLIRWIVIYPVDTAIQLLNNWGLINKFRDFRTRPLLRAEARDFPVEETKGQYNQRDFLAVQFAAY